MGIITKITDFVLKLSKPLYNYLSVEPQKIKDQVCIGI